MNSHSITEIRLELPVGTIAGKWWGPMNVRPILCLHGGEDNAGSFDELIPLLPKNTSYLAIDFPGHGLSSKSGNGGLYTMINFVHVVKVIKKHYSWDKVSIMGHSLGSVVGILFAGFFPDEIDLLIGIDKIIADVFNPKDFIKENRKRLEYLIVADERNYHNIEPPSYSYEVILEKMQINPSIDLNAAKILLKRGSKESEKSKGKFYFSRDGRLRVYNNLIMSSEMWTTIYENIRVPICFIQAGKSIEAEKDDVQLAVSALKDKPNFYHHLIEGRHHIHLTHPERVSDIISDFINELFVVKSKL